MPQWKQFSGNWTVTQQVQAKGAGTWPGIPGAPTIGTATAGNAQASVAFTAPANPGYPTTLTYEVTSSPGSITASGSASPIVVTGLTNGTEYTFTVTATNDTGTGPASASSNAVTPVLSGRFYSWGNGINGRLANGVSANTSSPAQVGGSNWLTLNSGGVSGVGVDSNNRVYAWGFNGNGQLGQNLAYAQLNFSFSPDQVGALTTWEEAVTNGYSMWARKNDGTLWAWGDNREGELGINEQTPTSARSSPVQIGAGTDWYKLTTNVTYSCSAAIKTDGTLWTWGNNAFGNLGHNDRVNRSSPTQVGTGTDWEKVNIGTTSTAIKTDGTIWVWGQSNDGSLGLNEPDGTDRSSPTQVGALTTWASISTWKVHTKVIKTDGTLWTWGYNFHGEQGRNDNIKYSSPVQVGALTNWAYIASSQSHVLSVKTDGTFWAWGKNDEGQIGLNGSVGVRFSSPVQVGSATDWAAPFSGGNNSFATKGS